MSVPLKLRRRDRLSGRGERWVCGCVSALFAHGMKILGNGILNGCVWHPKEENGEVRPMISLVFCNDVKIQGITMVDGGSWHMVPGACRNVEIEDVNIMSRVCTGDGIDIVGCEDVTLRNSFHPRFRMTACASRQQATPLTPPPTGT